jgi:hypothetical protein
MVEYTNPQKIFDYYHHFRIINMFPQKEKRPGAGLRNKKRK